MKVYIVTYYDYDNYEVEKVYSSKEEADKYADGKNKEADAIRSLNRICKKCEDNELSYKKCCEYANIKNDRYGLYCETSFNNASDYGEHWEVVEKDIE